MKPLEYRRPSTPLLLLLIAAAAAACTASDSTPEQPPPPMQSPAPAPSSSEEDTTAMPATSPPPAYCTRADRAKGLQDLTKTPNAPYFVHHPDDDATAPDTIVFIPGGPGSRETAEATFKLWLSRGSTLGKYRVIIPYSADDDLTDEGRRIVPVLDEVLACYGGTSTRVHLAGTSNGGRAAYALMLASPDRFITLLGSPGLFDTTASATDAKLSAALANKPILNVAGALDAQWKPLVKATHERLLSLNLASTYTELAGQGHVLTSSADQEVFFQFWEKH